MFQLHRSRPKLQTSLCLPSEQIFTTAHFESNPYFFSPMFLRRIFFVGKIYPFVMRQRACVYRWKNYWEHNQCCFGG